MRLRSLSNARLGFVSSGKVPTVIPDVKFEADSAEHLQRVAIGAQPGDRARIRHRQRTVVVVAVDGGPLGLIWEEDRGT